MQQNKNASPNSEALDRNIRTSFSKNQSDFFAIELSVYKLCIICRAVELSFDAAIGVHSLKHKLKIELWCIKKLFPTFAFL